MDHVQDLMFYLCHGTQRAPKTSAVPAPLLHAHTMCGSVRFFHDVFGNPSVSGKRPSNVWKVGIHENLWELPFYM